MPQVRTFTLRHLEIISVARLASVKDDLFNLAIRYLQRMFRFQNSLPDFKKFIARYGEGPECEL